MNKILVYFEHGTYGVLEYEVLVSAEDYLLVSQHPLYIQHHVNGYKVKRVVIKTKGGLLPLGKFLLGNLEGVVDHIDRNPLNNQRENLRVVSGIQNSQNRKLRVDSATGFIGVIYCADRQAFRAIYRPNGLRYQKDGFKTAREAALHYDKMVKAFSCLPDAPTNESLGLIK